MKHVNFGFEVTHIAELTHHCLRWIKWKVICKQLATTAKSLTALPETEKLI